MQIKALFIILVAAVGVAAQNEGYITTQDKVRIF